VLGLPLPRDDEGGTVAKKEKKGKTVDVPAGPKIEDVIDEVTGKLAVKHKTASDAAGVTSISVGPNVYAKRGDGSFLIYRSDAAAVFAQGLVRA